jgi:hypothetical protein
MGGKLREGDICCPEYSDPGKRVRGGCRSAESKEMVMT